MRLLPAPDGRRGWALVDGKPTLFLADGDVAAASDFLQALRGYHDPYGVDHVERLVRRLSVDQLVELNRRLGVHVGP